VKIENAAHQIPNMEAERNPATAHMFIVNPLSGRGMDNLFTTHPSTENRIAALQQLATELGTPSTTSWPGAAPDESSLGPWNRPPSSRGPWG